MLFMWLTSVAEGLRCRSSREWCDTSSIVSDRELSAIWNCSSFTPLCCYNWMLSTSKCTLRCLSHSWKETNSVYHLRVKTGIALCVKSILNFGQYYENINWNNQDCGHWSIGHKKETWRSEKQFFENMSSWNNKSHRHQQPLQKPPCYVCYVVLFWLCMCTYMYVRKALRTYMVQIQNWSLHSRYALQY